MSDASFCCCTVVLSVPTFHWSNTSWLSCRPCLHSKKYLESAFLLPPAAFLCLLPYKQITIFCSPHSFSTSIINMKFTIALIAGAVAVSAQSVADLPSCAVSRFLGDAFSKVEKSANTSFAARLLRYSCWNHHLYPKRHCLPMPGCQPSTHRRFAPSLLAVLMHKRDRHPDCDFRWPGPLRCSSQRIYNC